MTAKEKAALLDEGDYLLTYFELRMDKDLRAGDIERLWLHWANFFGALSILLSLGLLSFWEYAARLKTSVERYLKEAYPPVSPKEAKA